MLTALHNAGVKLQLGRAVQKIEKTVLYFGPGIEEAHGTKETPENYEALKNVKTQWAKRIMMLVF